jgi:hypothetical protein
MAVIRRVVIDILKPHEPGSVEFAQRIADLDGIGGVNAALVETDQQVQNVKLTIEGEDIGYDALSEVIVDLGGTIHSIDEVACGEYLVEESRTPQD